MITNFEKQTEALTDYERTTILPIMVKCLNNKIGKEAAITNNTMCEKMEEHGYHITPTRVRKIINHIRINNLIEGLMATSTGYYVTHDTSELRTYIVSLKGREEAIREMRESMELQLERMVEKCPPVS